MYIGIIEISMHIPYAASLKQKRSVVKSLIGKVQSHFKISVAETGDNDLWQRAKIGFAIVGNDAAFLDARLQKLMNYLEDNAEAEITDVFKTVEFYGDET